MTTSPPFDLAAIGESIQQPDERARTAAAQRQARLTKPAGALGRLEDLSVWLAGVHGVSPPRPLADARLVIFAGDHGVAAAGVSAFPAEVTVQMVGNFLAGGAAANVLARQLGARVRVVDLAVLADVPDAPEEVTRWKVRRGSGRIDLEDALTLDEAERAVRAGMEIADLEVDSGADVLLTGDMGIANTTPSSVLVAALTRSDPVAVMGRGTGVDDAGWMRKCAVIRDALVRARPHTGEPLELLAVSGGADLAAMTGFLLQAAVRRTPVILDGIVSGACALVAHQIAYRSGLWWVAGHRSTEPAHRIALDRLSLEPVVDYGLRLGEGTGALLALPTLRAAQATLAEMATFGEAGVSEKAAQTREPGFASQPEMT